VTLALVIAASAHSAYMRASATAAAASLLFQALDYTAAFTAAVAGLAVFDAQGALAACGSSGKTIFGMVVC
jgi:hypothetical protein